VAITRQHESSEVRTLEELFTGDRHVAMVMTMIGESHLSLNGRAQLSQDRQETDRLWNPYAAIYFEGQHDPEVAVLQFDSSGGQYWKAPTAKSARPFRWSR
jgi:general stress protein 26